jgi:hypothetical protein
MNKRRKRVYKGETNGLGRGDRRFIKGRGGECRKWKQSRNM